MTWDDLKSPEVNPDVPSSSREERTDIARRPALRQDPGASPPSDHDSVGGEARVPPARRVLLLKPAPKAAARVPARRAQNDPDKARLGQDPEANRISHRAAKRHKWFATMKETRARRRSDS